MAVQSRSAVGNVRLERVLTDDEVDRKKNDTGNATTGATAAGARALAARAVAFYFRAPVKAFFRTRVDYLAAARAINPRIQAQEGWSLSTSTPGLLAHAVRTHGWRFIPEQVLPPLIANVTIGAVLYTSYLSVLAAIHPGSGQSQRRVYPPPTFPESFAAGFSAGAISSVVAAPFDALQVRFDTGDMLSGRYTSPSHTMWQYGRDKLREIGLRGVLHGWGLSFAKDSLGYGAFFATFEYVKAQAFYRFVTEYYGRTIDSPGSQLGAYRQGPVGVTGTPTIRPHWALEPSFLLAAGVSATLAQQLIHYPLSVVQNIHYARLETIDHELQLQRQGQKGGPGRLAMAMSTYRAAYRETLRHCAREARAAGGWRRWLFDGFLVSTVRQVPSTSAGLIIFELVRRRYAWEDQEIRISKDGFEILLA